MTSTDASPAAVPPRRRQLATAVLVVFCLYVVALYVLALDQQFHWGWFPSKVDRQLADEVRQMCDTSLSAEKRQALMADLVGWNTFSVPILLKAIEQGPPAGRDVAAQCLQQISLKYYNADITPLGTDPAKLNDWWAKLQEQWAQAEKTKK